jgi:hypothetical protein
MHVTFLDDSPPLPPIDSRLTLEEQDLRLKEGQNGYGMQKVLMQRIPSQNPRQGYLGYAAGSLGNLQHL